MTKHDAPVFPVSRPERTERTDGLTAAVRVITLLLMLSGITVTLLRYPVMPPLDPATLDAATALDNSGPRWSVLVLCGVWALCQLGLALLSSHPRILNYPVIVTEENAQQLYREGERMLVWMGVTVCVIFFSAVLTFGGVPAIPLGITGLVALIGVSAVGVGRMLRV